MENFNFDQDSAVRFDADDGCDIVIVPVDPETGEMVAPDIAIGIEGADVDPRAGFSDELREALRGAGYGLHDLDGETEILSVVADPDEIAGRFSSTFYPCVTRTRPVLIVAAYNDIESANDARTWMRRNAPKKGADVSNSDFILAAIAATSHLAVCLLVRDFCNAAEADIDADGDVWIDGPCGGRWLDECKKSDFLRSYGAHGFDDDAAEARAVLESATA